MVVIGSKECENPAESVANDEKLVESLVEYSGDPLVKKAWEDGLIRHHRHPKESKPNRRPLKIELPSKTLRDSLLNGIRGKPGRPSPLPAPSFIRRDLTPHQLQLEREAREEVRKKNVEAGSLSFGLRDYSVITYSRPVLSPKTMESLALPSRTLLPITLIQETDLPPPLLMLPLSQAPLPPLLHVTRM